MHRVFASPGRYVQGRRAAASLPAEMEAAGLAGPVLILAGNSAREQLVPAWSEALDNPTVEAFGGESTAAEIDRVKQVAERAGAKTVVAAGGGKLIDTARAAASELSLGLVVCPTVASTDAPASAVSVIYSAEGVVETYRFYPRNPDLVLVDAEVIARAPARFLVAGMGDALATWFEARACAEARAQNQKGGLATEAGLAIARLCYDTLLADAAAARRDVERQAVTPAFERIVEANTLLSGLGFESGGLAAAHSIHNGLTVEPRAHETLHGEKVAFGVIVQLVLEGRDQDELQTVIELAKKLGLPTTLADLGCGGLTQEAIRAVAERAVAEDETIHHEPFDVDAAMVVDAIRAADAAGS